MGEGGGVGLGEMFRSAWTTHRTPDRKTCYVRRKDIVCNRIYADKTKYTVMSGEQTAGISHTMKVPLKGWKSSNIWERR